MACALPLTGSSGIPSAGQNMRESVENSSWLRLTAKTKKPSSFNSLPRASKVSIFGASASSARESATGRSNLELPRCAIRAGMTSCSWVAGRRSASATRSVVLNGNGASSSGVFWRNSIRGPSCSCARTSMMPVPECCRITPCPRRPSANRTAWAATVACPTNGASLRELKNRRRMSWSPAVAADTKATSACVNSRAIDIKVASVWPSASSTTAAGLPVKRVRVNASTWNMRK